MTVPPPPEETPQPSVSQMNQSGQNINVGGQGNYVAGGNIHITYTGPIEQLPVYPSTQIPKWIYIPHSPPASKLHTKVDHRKAKRRTQLLDNVYYTWIEGVLEKNLKAGDLAIEKDLKTDAVLTDANFNDYRLNPEASIGHIFHEMNGQLLILGNPGSGKTIMLLQLLQDLLIHVQDDPTQPIPIVLNLSSWTIEHETLKDWLVNEIPRLYDISKRLTRDWLEYEFFTLLLDGLDEVAEQVGQTYPRQTCIEAINRYRQDYPSVKMVICSRIADYKTLQEKLNLNSAITLRALTHKKILDYLQGSGTEGVRMLIEGEASAYEMAQTPFLLNTMKTTYAYIPYIGSPVRQLKLDAPTERTRRNHMFDIYMDLQMRKISLYSPQKALHYLKWLAFQMVFHKISVFYIEDLQPIMLKKHRSFGWKSILILGLCIGLLSVLSIGIAGVLSVESANPLSVGLMFALSIRLMFGLMLGLSLALIVRLIVGQDSAPELRVDDSNFSIPKDIVDQQHLGSRFKNSVIFTLSTMLIAMLSSTLFLESFLGLVGVLGVGLSAGLSSGGNQIIRHVILRYMLAHEGSIPPIRHFSITGGYDRFLDHAADLGLLRKVGGGYIFRHRMLMDYLAEQYEKAHPATATPSP